MQNIFVILSVLTTMSIFFLSIFMLSIWGECPVAAWPRCHSRDVSTASRDGSRGSPLNMTGLNQHGSMSALEFHFSPSRD